MRLWIAAGLIAFPSMPLCSETKPAPVASPGQITAKAEIAALRAAATKADEDGDQAAEHAATKRWVAVAQNAFGADSIDYGKAIFRHAFTLEEESNYREAEQLFRETLAIRTRLLGERHPDTLRALNALGDDLNDQGRWVESDALLREASRLRSETLGPRHPDTLQSLYFLAINLIDQQRFSEAESIARTVYDARKATLGPTDNLTISIASTLAHALDHLERFAESTALKETILRHRATAGDADGVLSAKNDLAFTLGFAGQHSRAESLNREVLSARLADPGSRPGDIGRSHGNLGDMLRISDRLKEASGHYRSALELSRKAYGDLHSYTLYYAGKLVTSMLSEQDGASLETARFALAGFRARRAAVTDKPDAESQHEREVVTEADQFLNLANALWMSPGSSGSARMRDEAFAAIQDADSGAASQAVAKMAARLAAEAKDDALGKLVRQRQDLSDEWAEADQRLGEALAKSSATDFSETAQLAERRSAIAQELADLDRAIAGRFPDYHSLVRPNPLTIASTQAMLSSDEGILLVAPSKFGTHVFAISRSKVAWARSAWTQDQIAAATAKLRRDLVEPVTTRADGYPSFDRSTAFALYSTLIKPVGAVLRGKKHLFVASQGSLSSLPFSILVTDKPEGLDDDAQALRSTKWFADEHALIQLPSIQTLNLLRNIKLKSVGHSAPSGTFAGFGDPVLAGPALTRGKQTARGTSFAAMFNAGASPDGKAIIEPEKLRALPSLPGTGTELRSMRIALGAPESSLWLRERATESALKKADLTSVSVLAIATHGLLAGEISGESEPGLVLTPPNRSNLLDDGYLSASDVAQLRLSADWVILSACNTAAGDGKNGASGLSGLARAFFYAGARNLLVSHWPVRDDVAADLTVDMLTRQMKGGQSKAVAMQQAMREVRLDQSDLTRAHPLSWAPFVVVGDGAR